MKQFLITPEDFGFKYTLHIRDKIRDDMILIPKSIEWEESKTPIRSEPIITFEQGEMSMLMDQLWIVGIRPSKRIIEPQNIDHMNSEISWLRSVVDHLMKRTES